MNDDIKYFDKVICPGFSNVDWDNIIDIKLKTEPLLREMVQRKELLRSLVTSIYDSKSKMKFSDREYGVIQKFMLHKDPEDKFRIRLHIIEKTNEELPHSHGMSFAALLMHGEYEHILYSWPDDGLSLIDATKINPIYQGREEAGKHYAIHHSLIHETRVCGDGCITLMVRGPRQKKRAINIDVKNKKSRWQESAADLEVDYHQVMDESDIDRLVARLESHDLI